MEWLYLTSLVFVIACLVLVDWRYKLAFFHDVRRTSLTLAIAIWLFIAWDVLGIKLGIFFHGGSAYTLPFRIILGSLIFVAFGAGLVKLWVLKRRSVDRVKHNKHSS